MILACLASSALTAAARFSSLRVVLSPMIPPPHFRNTSVLSLNLTLHASQRLVSSDSSFCATLVMATQVAVCWVVAEGLQWWWGWGVSEWLCLIGRDAPSLSLLLETRWAKTARATARPGPATGSATPRHPTHLLVHESTETSLVLHDRVRDALETAEGREPDDELDRVDVRGDENQAGLLLLDEAGDVVEAKLEDGGLGRLDLVAGGLGLGGGLAARGALLARLRLVLGCELEELGGEVLVRGVVELVDLRRDLEPLLQDALLPLDAHVLGPLDEAGEVLLLADARGARVGSKDELVLGLDAALLSAASHCSLVCCCR